MINRVEQLGFIIQRLNTAYQKQLVLINRALMNYQLNLPKLNVLIYLSRQDGKRLGVMSIAQALQLNQPKASKIIHSLVKQSLLSWESSASDGRLKEIKISKKGMDTAKQAYQALNPVMLEMFGGYSGEDLKQFANHLEKFCSDCSALD